MRPLYFIFSALLLLCLGCSKSDENVLPDQQAKFVSYLTATHVPRLLSEEAKEESLDENPEYYTSSGESVYRYIRHIYDPEREQYPQVEYGDRVTLTLWMYVFNFSNIVLAGTEVTMPYYTNDPKLEQALIEVGLTTDGGWPFLPLELEFGQTEIIKGLEHALPGCRERDTVETYMTFNMAYGKKPFGIIPKQSPIAVFFTVDKVTKN